jgi:hypothetical protein
MGPRVGNALLGLWLFLSAFLWDHSVLQFHNAWVVGTLVVTAALAGLTGAQWGRFLNAALGGWLIATALTWSRGGDFATFWNHALVGMTVALFAFAPSWRAVRRRESARI